MLAAPTKVMTFCESIYFFFLGGGSREGGGANIKKWTPAARAAAKKMESGFRIIGLGRVRASYSSSSSHAGFPVLEPPGHTKMGPFLFLLIRSFSGRIQD